MTRRVTPRCGGRRGGAAGFRPNPRDVRIFGWDVDPVIVLVAAVVWVVIANLWVWWGRRLRGQRMQALAQRRGLEYFEQADRIESEAFLDAQILNAGFNAVLDPASAVTYAVSRRRFTQALEGRIEGALVRVFDVETPRFRSLHPDRRTIIAWDVTAAGWPQFYVNPMAFGVDTLSALQGLRDQEGVEVRVGESLANFAEDHLGISVESHHGWLLLGYVHRVMEPDEVEKTLRTSHAMLIGSGVQGVASAG